MKPFIPSKVAEVVFALLVAMFGIFHFKGGSSMAGYVPGFLPGGGTIWVYISGACLVLAAIAIISGIQKTVASYLLALLLLVFVFTIHIPHLLGGDQAAMGMLLKDSGMAMCAILIGNRTSK